jgi:uncharacterized membrane protein (UPF0127 family)
MGGTGRMSQRSPTWAGTAGPPYRLVVDDVPVADAWLTHRRADRRTGLLGTDGLVGADGAAAALLIDRCSSVHTAGMRYPLDVAYLTRTGRVLGTSTMAPGRLGRPRLRARSVLEAPAGALAGWGVRAGAQVRLLTSD